MEENETKGKFEVTKEAVENNNWFKKNQKIVISIAVIIVIVIAALLIWMTVGQDSGTKTFKDYVNATFSGDTNKMMELTDLKATYAWINSGRDASRFKEEYDKITDDEIKKYESEYKNSLTSSFSSYASLFGGQVDIEVGRVEKTEDLGNDLQKYKGTIKIKVLGIENETDMTMVIYKGKYVVDLSE